MLFSEKEFRHTFFQTQRGFEYNKAMFDTADDEYRICVLGDHKSYYSRYRGEIHEWLGSVWDKLHAERPGWFTEEVVGRIPVEFIPHLREQGVKEEIGKDAVEVMRSRRRNSPLV